MANELIFSGDPATQSGLTVTGKVYTTAFVQQGSDVTMTEVGSLAGYRGDMPTASAGTYIVRYFNGSALLAQEQIEWDGSKVLTLRDMLTQQQVRDALGLTATDGTIATDIILANIEAEVL